MVGSCFNKIAERSATLLASYSITGMFLGFFQNFWNSYFVKYLWVAAFVFGKVYKRMHGITWLIRKCNFIFFARFSEGKIYSQQFFSVFLYCQFSFINPALVVYFVKIIVNHWTPKIVLTVTAYNQGRYIRRTDFS